MSVFKKLKGSFQTAHQDIIDGLRSLTSTENQSRNISSKQVNLDAGADLLHRFHGNWSLLHYGISESAQIAEEVAVLLTPMFNIWDKYAESVTDLELEARKIAGVFATMAQLHTLLDSLRQDFLVAEKALDMLEDICEEQDYTSRCLKEQKKLAVYKAKRESEVEKFKVDFAHLHAKKMAEIESVKKVNLQERAEAFMSAFQDDVKYYHTHGHPDRFPAEHSLVSSLSRIELDQDSQALDSFLGANGESDGPGNLESSGEGAYFEDDYITDYSVKHDVDFLEVSDYSSSSVIREMELEEEGSFYEKNHSYDNDYQQDLQEADKANLPSSSQFVDDHRRDKDTVEDTERVDGDARDISQTADSTDVSSVGRSNEAAME